jgi:hypothetical protein
MHRQHILSRRKFIAAVLSDGKDVQQWSYYRMRRQLLRHQLYLLRLYELLERVELRVVSDGMELRQRAENQLQERILWNELYCVRHGRKMVGWKQLRNMHGELLLHGQWQQDGVPGGKDFARRSHELQPVRSNGTGMRAHE